MDGLSPAPWQVYRAGIGLDGLNAWLVTVILHGTRTRWTVLARPTSPHPLSRVTRASPARATRAGRPGSGTPAGYRPAHVLTPPCLAVCPRWLIVRGPGQFPGRKQAAGAVPSPAAVAGEAAGNSGPLIHRAPGQRAQYPAPGMGGGWAGVAAARPG